jgi:hypothetical protein
VREQMRALSYAQARGDASATGEATVMYLDATDDDLPGAVAPKLKYVQTGDVVSVRSSWWLRKRLYLSRRLPAARVTSRRWRRAGRHDCGLGDIKTLSRGIDRA